MCTRYIFKAFCKREGFVDHDTLCTMRKTTVNGLHSPGNFDLKVKTNPSKAD